MGAADAFRIFINYRRDDSSGHAGRLYDELSRRFGEETVFMDVDQIPPGVDFAEVIEKAVASTHVFLAVIGPRWLTVEDGSGSRRLDKPEDWVRMEIEAAFRPGVLLIPVRVGNAEMPSSDELPEALAPLARKNGVEIRDTSWRSDIDRLIRAIEKIERQVATVQAEAPQLAKPVEAVPPAYQGAPQTYPRPAPRTSGLGSFRDPVQLLPLAADEQLVWSGGAAVFFAPGRFALPPTEGMVHSLGVSIRVTNKRLLLEKRSFASRQDPPVSIPWSEVKDVEWTDQSYREWLVKRREKGVVSISLSGLPVESRGFGFGEDPQATIHTSSLVDAQKIRNRIKAQLS